MSFPDPDDAPALPLPGSARLLPQGIVGGGEPQDDEPPLLVLLVKDFQALARGWEAALAATLTINTTFPVYRAKDVGRPSMEFRVNSWMVEAAGSDVERNRNPVSMAGSLIVI